MQRLTRSRSVSVSSRSSRERGASLRRSANGLRRTALRRTRSHSAIAPQSNQVLQRLLWLLRQARQIRNMLADRLGLAVDSERWLAKLDLELERASVRVADTEGMLAHLNTVYTLLEYIAIKRADEFNKQHMLLRTSSVQQMQSRPEGNAKADLEGRIEILETLEQRLQQWLMSRP